jgi:hypothetical protein
MLKKIITTSLVLVVALNFFAQAKKPTIMIKPADDWMNQPYPNQPNVNFMMEFDNQGLKEMRPNYEVALLKYSNLNSVIGKIDAEMRKDGFETVLLETTLKELKQNQAENDARVGMKDKAPADPIEELRAVAKADIEFLVYWKVKKQGPRHAIESFRLQGIDTYTNKPVAYAEGSGDWASINEVSEGDLLREAILSKMDGFKAELMATFTKMFEEGREVVLEISVAPQWGKTLQSTFQGDELNIKIEDWVNDNTKKHRFGAPTLSKMNMTFKGCKIELYNASGRAQDAGVWVRPLKKYLTELGVPNVLVDPVGLGRVKLFLSDKSPE